MKLYSMWEKEEGGLQGWDLSKKVRGWDERYGKQIAMKNGRYSLCRCGLRLDS